MLESDHKFNLSSVTRSKSDRGFGFYMLFSIAEAGYFLHSKFIISKHLLIAKKLQFQAMLTQ